MHTLLLTLLIIWLVWEICKVIAADVLPYILDKLSRFGLWLLLLVLLDKIINT